MYQMNNKIIIQKIIKVMNIVKINMMKKTTIMIAFYKIKIIRAYYWRIKIKLFSNRLKSIKSKVKNKFHKKSLKSKVKNMNRIMNKIMNKTMNNKVKRTIFKNQLKKIKIYKIFDEIYYHNYKKISNLRFYFKKIFKIFKTDIFLIYINVNYCCNLLKILAILLFFINFIKKLQQFLNLILKFT